MANLIKQVTTATSGVINCPDTQQDVIIIHEAGVTLTLTIAFPSTPVDGQRVCMSSVGGITTLTLSAVIGTIMNLVSALVAGTPAAYMYSAAQTKWYKVT